MPRKPIKKYPGPKNYTKKYKTKSHNPVPEAVINLNKRKVGTVSGEEPTFITGGPTTKMPILPLGEGFPKPQPKPIPPFPIGTPLGTLGAPISKRRTGQIIFARKQRASVGRLRGGMFGRASARRRALRKKKRGPGF